MSYIALARKWRPRTFSELVGQPHVSTALVNALNQQRIHHAYLFTGTRGVGKTSVARILAKALNCEQGISSSPCLFCDACTSIEHGRFIDLIEIDGASKTKVEDTRELLENVQYATVIGRFKIYLIDEVHMLSQHSFNALLKTLEEPPSHVKFIFATTDPQKIPPTILSRCLQFNLKHLDPKVIGNQLQFIIDAEQQQASLEAVQLLARAANGSMRDALSMLDQVIVDQSTPINLDHVKAMLGYTQQDFAIQLLHAIIQQNASQLIQLCRQISAEGGYFDYVIDEIISYLHQIILCKLLPADNTPQTNAIQQLAHQMTLSEPQILYQIAIKGTKEMYLAQTLTIGFEMVLLRMLTVGMDKMEFSTPSPSPTVNIQDPSMQPAVAVVESIDWDGLSAKLNLTGIARTAIKNAEFISKTDTDIVLGVNKGHQALFTASIIKKIEQELSNVYKTTIKLILQINSNIQNSPLHKQQRSNVEHANQAQAALDNDVFFQELQQEFSAEIVQNSISLIK
ncbi:MAG: DNA polymerase III, subunit gamma and tau [Legionellales bacterium RIFCSPHIGHO2_12_FULL_42_9]|nr:MAG: DNA polymerase III, subunit gamma and tau [Legionellales bacterium RIFCSPHIGHO2_12_FULL_42_9]